MDDNFAQENRFYVELQALQKTQSRSFLADQMVTFVPVLSQRDLSKVKDVSKGSKAIFIDSGLSGIVIIIFI